MAKKTTKKVKAPVAKPADGGGHNCPQGTTWNGKICAPDVGP